MANLDLSKYGITDVKEVLHNPSYDVLFAEETKPGLEGFEKGQVTELGAVNVMTGVFTQVVLLKINSSLRMKLLKIQYGGLLTNIKMITNLVQKKLGLI